MSDRSTSLAASNGSESGLRTPVLITRVLAAAQAKYPKHIVMMEPVPNESTPSGVYLLKSKPREPKLFVDFEWRVIGRDYPAKLLEDLGGDITCLT